MQTQIKEWRSVYGIGVKARIVNVDKGDRRLCQYLPDIVIPPRLMSEFDNIVRTIGDMGNNTIQIFLAIVEACRELKKKILKLILKVVL